MANEDAKVMALIVCYSSKIFLQPEMLLYHELILANKLVANFKCTFDQISRFSIKYIFLDVPTK